MDAKAYLRRFVTVLHREFAVALDGLSEAQLYHQPADGINHIAFVAWHCVRNEDMVVQSWLLERPTVWLAHGLDQRWKLPSEAQGTGMAPAEAGALRLPSLVAFMEYARSVWAATETHLDGLTPENLNGRVPAPFLRDYLEIPDDDLPLFELLGQTLLFHPAQHLGEISVLRQLQGLPGTGA